MPASTPAADPGVLVLGTVRVRGRDGAVLPPRGVRAAALVTLLALADGRAVPVAALVRDLWDEDLPTDPRAALQNLVSRLRASAVPEVVVAGDAGYRLGVGTDLHAVRRLLADARAALAGTAGSPPDPALAGALADAALTTWGGGPDDAVGAELDGGPFAAVGTELRAVAARLRADLVGVRREAAAAAGEHDVVVALAGAALDDDPTDEAAAAALMTALGATGRTADALRVFDRVRGALVRELGADPGPGLVALHARLVASDVPGASAAGDLAEGPGAAPGAAGPAGARVTGGARGLRTWSTPLLGREADVEAVLGALRSSRLVTVLGAGGLGKTRLAQEVARRATARTPSVVVVELAGVRTDDDVVVALADALGIAPGGRSARLADRVQAGGLAAQVRDRVRDVPTLLVLDNCEHVVDGAARWADGLLADAPELRVLTTSRTPLLLAEETTYPLGPLGADPSAADGGAAVRLFVERARAVRPDAVLDPAVVGELCARLDGLPLAIELAAARVRTLAVEEVAARIDERFALLRSQDRSAPDRHRTLEAVLDWSWNLLTAGQRRLWRRAAVLPDGFSAQAARALVPEEAGWQVDDDVAGLALQSLLRVEEADGVARYRMVETVREFGLLRLETAGESETARDAALAWALEVARRCARALLGPEQLVAMGELRREQENLVGAVRVAVATGRPDVAVHGFVALLGSWMFRGAEDRAVGLAPAVLDALAGWDVPDEDADAAALTLTAVTATSLFGGEVRVTRAMARLRRLLRTSPAVGERTRAVARLVLVASPEELAAALAGLRTSDDGYTALVAHLSSAQQAENDGRLHDAAALAARTLEIAESLGDAAGTAIATMFLASCTSELGDAAATRRWAARARVGMSRLAAEESMRQLDWLELTSALTLGDLEAAGRLVDAVADALERGLPGASAPELAAVVEIGRGEIAWAGGRRDDAVRHLLAAQDAFGPERTGDAVPWYLMLSAATLVRLVEARRGPEADGLVRALLDQLGRVQAAWRGFVDRPVLGTASLGVAAWAALAPGDTGDTGDTGDPASSPRVAAGLELLALAELLGSRQDLPALRHDALRDAARARHAEAAEAARRAASALGHDERVARVHVLLDVVRDVVGMPAGPPPDAGHDPTGGWPERRAWAAGTAVER